MSLTFGGVRCNRYPDTDLAVYHGERARFHYYQCLQVILRMQITALTRLWELPSEFEVRYVWFERPQRTNLLQKTCRDIWALHLSLLPNPPSAEPLFHLEGGSGQSSSKVHSGGESDGHETDRSKRSEAIADSSPSSSESEDSDHDSELDRLMRENSLTPSSSDQEDEEGSKQQRARVAIPKKRQTLSKHDAPANTISVLVVACWTLRLPVMYINFLR